MPDIPVIIRELMLFLLLALAVILFTRRLKIPDTLGLVVVGLVLALFGLLPEAHLSPALVLFVFLPALLFEGAWSTKIKRLRENWQEIFLLAGPGILLSLIVIAGLVHLFAGLSWPTALLLAAILSPTDPIAVLGLFRQLRVNERLSTIIEGESLFNDGVAGSLYQTFLAVVLSTLPGSSTTAGLGWGEGLLLFVIEAGGGIVLGLACGWGVSYLIKWIDDSLIETTITLIVAYGVYLLADTLHTSALLAVIAAGLVLGSYGRYAGMSERTREAVDGFWSTIAFLANALIFLLVGMQLNPLALLTSPSGALRILLIATLAVSVVLLARFLLVVVLFFHSRGRWSPPPIPRSWALVVFWSGLRGALSLALVLALPVALPGREVLLVSAYAVVLFTLLVQGLSLRFVLARLPNLSAAPPTEHGSPSIPNEALSGRSPHLPSSEDC